MSAPRPYRKLARFLTLALVVAAAPAVAEQPGSRQTRDFVQAAAQSDQFETLEAQSVLAGSGDAEVKAFAQEMIRDHRRTSDALKAAAAQSGLAQPSPGIAGDQSMFLAALQSARGVDLDRTYAKQQVLAHRAALAVMQGYATSGDDPMLRKLATSTVPLIQSHERMAERMAARFGGA